MFGLAITAGQVIAWAIEHRAQIAAVSSAAIKYAPEVIAIVKEGTTALHAVKTAAPELVPHIKELASGLMQYLPKGSPATADDVTEAVTQHLFGPPGWTNDETQRWFDRSSVANA